MHISLSLSIQCKILTPVFYLFTPFKFKTSVFLPRFIDLKLNKIFKRILWACVLSVEKGCGGRVLGRARRNVKGGC